jgi:hypothetical protein
VKERFAEPYGVGFICCALEKCLIRRSDLDVVLPEYWHLLPARRR